MLWLGVLAVIGLLLFWASTKGESAEARQARERQAAAEAEERERVEALARVAARAKASAASQPMRTIAEEDASGITVRLRTDYRAPVPMAPKRNFAVDDSIPISAASFVIAYRDAEDEPSRRRIEVRGFSDFDGRIYLEAWCHMRRAMRSFRVDRIRQMVAVETGEVIEDAAAYAPKLKQMLFDPGRDFASVMDKSKGGLSVLIWIARSDSDLSDDEMDLLCRFVGERDTLHRARKTPADCNETMVRRAIENARPRLQDAAGALSLMAPDGPERALVKAYARQLAVMNESASKRARRVGFSDLDI